MMMNFLQTMRRHGRFLLLPLLLLPLLLLSGCRDQQAAYEALNQLLADTFPADGPGVVLLVNSPAVGEQIAKRGRANLAQGDPIQARSHFRIGDITKTFVSTLVFQMVEEGEMALADPIARHLPAAIAARLPQEATITVEHLLIMRSGLPDYRDDPNFATAVAAEPIRAWAPEETLAFVYDKELRFPPGSEFHYSNTNYILLQIMIEEIMEEPLDEVLRDRILERLAIQDTYMEVSEALPGGYVPGYLDMDGDGELEPSTQLGDARGLGDLGLISNVLDLAEFTPALYQRSFTGEEGRERSLETADTDLGYEYGLGIMRRDSPWGPMWGHTNDAPGFSGAIWFLPESETTLVVLSNGQPPTAIADLVDAALQIVLEGE